MKPKVLRSCGLAMVSVLCGSLLLTACGRRPTEMDRRARLQQESAPWLLGGAVKRDVSPGRTVVVLGVPPINETARAFGEWRLQGLRRQLGAREWTLQVRDSVAGLAEDVETRLLTGGLTSDEVERLLAGVTREDIVVSLVPIESLTEAQLDRWPNLYLLVFDVDSTPWRSLVERGRVAAIAYDRNAPPPGTNFQTMDTAVWAELFGGLETRASH
ncbi:MAG: hypothetical protein JJU05_14685 [Verrucomicrobia bacterium]|nr:hypothetical protein [Verrucomicrobiota bacterium]MCH8528026.1 hypothetical protein [Kiritimatiellia bacterium]